MGIAAQLLELACSASELVGDDTWQRLLVVFDEAVSHQSVDIEWRHRRQ